MVDPLSSLLPDEFLVKAVSGVTLPRGEWAELFLERADTLRGEWDPRRGIRILPGSREGFALRRAGPRGQEHRAVEGLTARGILSATRGPGGPAKDNPPEREGEEPGGSAGEAGRMGSLLASLAGELQARIPEGIPLSLTLEWRRRRIGVVTPGHPPRWDAAARCVLTCRAGSPPGEIVLGAGAGDPATLLERQPPEALAREILLRLEEGRDARDAPEGESAVILAPGTGGVFFHEACGHALEGDLVLQEASAFRNLLGERVAPEFVSAMDDPSRPGLEGSYALDDEGTPCRGTVLIDRGKLEAFLTDRVCGERLGRGTSGNGRRESFRDLPLPRMSNTFLMAGEEDPEEILRQTPRGIYVRRLEGGRVDTATGEFLFRAGSGSLIEEGRLTAPLRPFTIAGNGLAALRGIERVGGDLDFGTGAGSCGKEGQKIPVAVGQPTLRLRLLAIRPG